MLTLTIQLDDGRIIVVRGRAAWALIKLITAGTTGCSIFDYPAPRWGSYVYRLRKLGIPIVTNREAHGGQFAGHHARYVLRTRITILQQIGDKP
jgi:hypothetical protein